MRNLKLKREALDKLDLPVDVLEGKYKGKRVEKEEKKKLGLVSLTTNCYRPLGRIHLKYTMVESQEQTSYGVYTRCLYIGRTAKRINGMMRKGNMILLGKYMLTTIFSCR